MSSNSRSKQKKNPITRFMIWLVAVVFAFAGISIITGQDWLLSQLFLPLLFFCTLTFTVWTFLEYRRGILSTVSSATGQVSHIKRGKEPVLFFIWVVVYFIMGLVLTSFMGYGLLFG